MKNYQIEIDVTLSGTFFVEAESEEEAKAQFEEKLKNEPYYYAKKADRFLSYEITDVIED